MDVGLSLLRCGKRTSSYSVLAKQMMGLANYSGPGQLPRSEGKKFVKIEKKKWQFPPVGCPLFRTGEHTLQNDRQAR